MSDTPNGWITLAQLEEKAATTPPAVAVVEYLAACDGYAPLRDVREQYTDQDIETAINKPEGDKRQQALAGATTIGGEVYLYLTGSGWQRLGINRRTTHPKAESAAHRLAPGRFREWLESWLPGDLTPGPFLDDDSYILEITADKDARSELNADVVARAWGEISKKSVDEVPGLIVAADKTGRGGYMPDAIMVERTLPNIAETIYGHHFEDQEAAQIMTSIEFERAGKSGENIVSKLKKAQAAIELGSVQHVLWVVSTRRAWDALNRSGLGIRGMHPGQYLLPAWYIPGMEAEPFQVDKASWKYWPHLRLWLKHQRAE